MTSRLPAVLILATVLFGLPPSARAQTVRTVEALAVYDALGRRLGDVNWPRPWFPQTEVVLASRGRVMIVVTATGYDTVGIGFESADCSGQGYVQGALHAGSIPIAVVTGPRSTLHLTRSPGRSRTIGSVLSGNVCGEPGLGWAGRLFAIHPELDLADYFTPPFRVRARGEVVPAPEP